MGQGFQRPSGYTFPNRTSVQIRTNEATGEIFVSSTIQSGSTSKIEIFKISSSGALSTTATYSPSSGYENLQDIAIAPDGSFVGVGYYNSSPSSTVTFVLKYTANLTGGVVRAISVPGVSYDCLGGSLAIDGSGNVYVGAVALPSSTSASPGASILTKFNSALGATPVWQTVDNHPAGSTVVGGGCRLLLDSSGRLTFVASIYGTTVDTTLSDLHLFVSQHTSESAFNWALDPGIPSIQPFNVILDGSDVVIAGCADQTSYTLAKLSGSNGSTVFSTAYAYPGRVPASLARDTSGDYLLAYPYTSGSTVSSVVDRFSSTGSYVTSYTYTGAGLGDYAYGAFPTSTSGDFLVAGVGKSGTLYYPLCYRVGATSWGPVYQTALTP